MATLSFEVHTDKENANCASIHRKSIKGSTTQPLASRDRNKFAVPGPTIRKALHNVNQQVPNASSRGLSFAKNVPKDINIGFSQSKSSLAVRPGSVDIENMPVNSFSKKIDRKKSPTISKKGIQGSAELKKNSKSRSSKTKVKIDVEPIPHIDIPNEDEYDSDSIFPRTERLSSYVDKLLMWRPPCLFGSIPESDSEISDHDDDIVLNEDICNVPVFLAEVPEFPSPEELPEDLVEIPPVDIEGDSPETFNRTMSPEPLSDLSFNKSLPLGPLEIVPEVLPEASNDSLESL